MQSTEAVIGLIEGCSGKAERGFSRLNEALNFAKRVYQVDVPDYLGMHVDAYEAAGDPDKALEYLQELVAWKKKSIEAEVMPLQYKGLTEPIRFQVGVSLSDAGLLAKAHSLRTDIQDRIERFVEVAIKCGRSPADVICTERFASQSSHAVLPQRSAGRSGP